MPISRVMHGVGRSGRTIGVAGDRCGTAPLAVHLDAGIGPEDAHAALFAWALSDSSGTRSATEGVTPHTLGHAHGAHSDA